ncbi:beta-1,3-galactosyltransferase brn [Prorops nasuta]|uniref:beta-1,3-galactosyltransferase brn n=1 Tax=Prorops nasuta TaxID=863751 RepID=UPI0034CE4636
MYYILKPWCQISLRLMSRIKIKYVCVTIITLLILDFFGAFTHVFEVSYKDNFAYPYEGQVHLLTEALKHKRKPAIPPINEYNYTFLLNNAERCSESGINNYRVIYLIKSALDHFDRRLAIRNSWGFEKRFFDVPSKTFFILGISVNNEELEAKIKVESSKYKDIIQANFIDSYYNNTIKTMMGFKWLVNYCSNSKFFMFVDDDMYISVRNVLRFIRNPANYPDYLREPKKLIMSKREIKESDFIEKASLTNDSINVIFKNSEIPSFLTKQDVTGIKQSVNVKHNMNVSSIRNFKQSVIKRNKRQIYDMELPEDIRLFAGYVFVSSPHRHKSSKWYVSLEEYPYDQWPPYVTAGAYILSKDALIDLFYTSFYTKHFKFDDIYLGLLSQKADIEPFHCEEFHFYKKDYTKHNYKYVISSHGYGDPNELLRVWNEQKALGNA